MNEKAKALAYEIKLKKLKEEEEFILKILKDVQRQLEKYEVEELQTSSASIENRLENDESESDESVDGNPESLLKILDSAELVNDASLNLTLNKILGKENDSEEIEEFDDTD